MSNAKYLIINTLLSFLFLVSCGDNLTELTVPERKKAVHIEVIVPITKLLATKHDVNIIGLCEGISCGSHSFTAHDEEYIKDISYEDVLREIKGVLSDIPFNTEEDSSYYKSRSDQATMGIGISRKGWKHFTDFNLRDVNGGVVLKVWHKGVSQCEE